MTSIDRTMDASTAFAPFPTERDALLRMTPAERTADTAHRRALAISHLVDDEHRDAERRAADRRAERRNTSLAGEVLALQS